MEGCATGVTFEADAAAGVAAGVDTAAGAAAGVEADGVLDVALTTGVDAAAGVEELDDDLVFLFPLDDFVVLELLTTFAFVEPEFLDALVLALDLALDLEAVAFRGIFLYSIMCFNL